MERESHNKGGCVPTSNSAALNNISSPRNTKDDDKFEDDEDTIRILVNQKEDNPGENNQDWGLENPNITNQTSSDNFYDNVRNSLSKGQDSSLSSIKEEVPKVQNLTYPQTLFLHSDLNFLFKPL